MTTAEQTRLAREKQRRDRGTLADQPRPYWVALLQDERQVMERKPYMISLDLTPGLPFEDAAARLDALLRGMIKAGNVRKSDIPTCALAVHDWDTSQVVFFWPVTWEPE